MHAWYERARRATLYCFTLFLVTALGSGCGIFSPDESKDDGGGGPSVDFPLATEPTILIANFEKAWENLNILEYENVLHPDFYFWFAPDDIAEINTSSWGRAEEVQSVGNMFSGETGVEKGENGEDVTVPAIVSFTMQLVQLEGWRDDFDDGAEFAGADFRSRFAVTMEVRYTDAGRITAVTGDQFFYAKRVSTVIDGQSVDIYQLFAWKDTGSSAS